MKNLLMVDDEAYWEKRMSVDTIGQTFSHGCSVTHAPYEPTSYYVLARLVKSGYITRHNTICDYGCGKGRVCFFLAYNTQCQAIGVEYDQRLLDKAFDNLKQFIAPHLILFRHEDAAVFTPPAKVDRCYFFRPFSSKIFKASIANLSQSLQKYPRTVLLFLYYPAPLYIEYLQQSTEFRLVDVIECQQSVASFDSLEGIVVFSSAKHGV